MTSEKRFQGIGELNRNTSRVLNPPGGASSFSLGGNYGEPPKPKAPPAKENVAPPAVEKVAAAEPAVSAAAAPQEQACPADNHNSISTQTNANTQVSAGTSPIVIKGKPQGPQTADGAAGARVVRQDVFEKPHQELPHKETQKKRNESSIFGSDEPAAPTRNSSKVIAPPGGKSSGIFFG
jgi:hypothetical protein